MSIPKPQRPHQIISSDDGYFMFWGPITSTIDWCEENYATVHCFAEFWNAVTNLTFFLLAAIGAYRVWKMKLESRFILCYLGMAMVGTGSWLFHMTLKYEWQLADELPMIYCTAFALNCLLQAQRKSPSGKLVPFLLFLYCFGVTLIYLVNRNPVFHEVAYGLQVLFYTVYGAYVQKGVSKAKPHLHKNMVGIMSHAFFAFLLSFIVWNLDNMYCDTLREIRFRVHPVISPLFQFHALWHIGTGIGCYGAIVYQQMLRIVILDQDHMYSIKYFLGLIPYIADIRGELKQRKA